MTTADRSKSAPAFQQYPTREPGYMDAAIVRLKEIHRRIVVRNGGQLIDVDAVLDEIRGYSDASRS